MEFRYSAAQADLKRRAAAYTALLQRYEDESEREGGPLPEAIVRELTQAAMENGFQTRAAEMNLAKLVYDMQGKDP